MKKLNILYEDKYLIIFYKRHGLLTIQRDNHNDLNLYDEVKEYEKKKNPRNKIFIVHRLDKDTSGLVLFANNEKIKYALQNNWDKVIRKYYAVVEKEVLENKTLINYLQESKTGEVFVTNNKVIGKKSITKYEVLSKNNKCSLLDIEIKTGRKNQIRVQLAYILHPIIGDKKYGNTKNKELLLQAYYLKFNHPVDNKKIIIKTDIEKSLTSYLQQIIVYAIIYPISD